MANATLRQSTASGTTEQPSTPVPPTPRVELVSADPVLLGMQMGNLILAAVYGIERTKG